MRKGDRESGVVGVGGRVELWCVSSIAVLLVSVHGSTVLHDWVVVM